jgi:hypothetical protein
MPSNYGQYRSFFPYIFLISETWKLAGFQNSVTGPDLAGAENLCHLDRRPEERGRFSPAFGIGQAGLGSARRGMILGLWA